MMCCSGVVVTGGAAGVVTGGSVGGAVEDFSGTSGSVVVLLCGPSVCAVVVTVAGGSVEVVMTGSAGRVVVIGFLVGTVGIVGIVGTVGTVGTVVDVVVETVAAMKFVGNMKSTTHLRSKSILLGESRISRRHIFFPISEIRALTVFIAFAGCGFPQELAFFEF